MDPSDQPLQNLADLVRFRNDLVHAKPQAAITLDEQGFNLSPSFQDYYSPSIDVATRCVNTISSLVTSLKDIDGSVETDWLQEDIFSRVFYNTAKKTPGD